MLNKKEFRLVKDEYNSIYSVVSLGECIEGKSVYTNENPNRLMQDFVNWKLDEGDMSESVISSLLNMIMYCDDLEGRKAIKEQIDNCLYYQNIDEIDFY